MDQEILVLIEHLRGEVAEISYVMLAAGRSLAEVTGVTVTAVLLGHESQGLAANLAADQVLYLDHVSLADFTPEVYQNALAQLIRARSPRLVLFGDTSIGVEVAGPLSVHLELPLVSNCRTLRADGEALKFVSQVCGGKIMVEGDLPLPTVLVTIVPGGYKPESGVSPHPPAITSVDFQLATPARVVLKQYIEPETGDVDITKVDLLVAIGRGIQNPDNIELAEELASALGGVVCASRPVVDQGWLPAARLVGKSGKRVKPKVYLALGISGAPEHTEAITASGTVIAVNIDPNAPIFNLARYGVEMDVLDLLPVLTETVLQQKGR
jgi:electron transfer flavoprotein alpha subunit